MKNKIIFSLIIFVAFLLVFCCSVNAANVLIISEENVVHGKTVATMLGMIASDDFNIAEESIESGKSLLQTVDSINTTERLYDIVVIQPPLNGNKDSFTSDCTDAINSLNAQIGKDREVKYYICTPIGNTISLSNQEQEIKASEEAVEEVVSKLTTIKASKIPVYEILKEATNAKYLEVYSNNSLTTLGDLLVACTYCNSLGIKVDNLSTYPGLNNTEVQSVTDLANDWGDNNSETSEPEVITETTNSITDNTANTSNKTNTTNTTNSISTEDRDNVEKTDAPTDVVTFRTDREPRLTYIKEKPDYLFIEIRDMAGIACEYPSYYMGEKCEASKSMQPQIYYYENDKRGNTVSGLKRPAEDEYKLVKRENEYHLVISEYVYTIGLPVSEISEEFKKFEIVAYDVKSPYKKSQYFIDEVFMVKKSSAGELTVNRAPTSFAVTTKSTLNQMSLQVADGTGVSTIDMKTLPKGVGEYSEVIRTWNGRAEENWSAISKTTTNGEYVKEGLTKFEKIDTIFKKSSWVGLNPKLAEEDGVYVVLITAEDASGACSVKTMNFDTRYYIWDGAYIKTGNGTITQDVKYVYDPQMYPMKTTSKDIKNTTSGTSSKNNSGTSSKGNSGGSSESKSSGNSGSSSGGNSGSSSGGNSGSSSGEDSKDNSEESTETNSSTIKKGSKGEDVNRLQKMLNELGYNLEVDGDFGTNTEKAVKDFQKKKGLNANGVVGPDTWTKLSVAVMASRVKDGTDSIVESLKTESKTKSETKTETKTKPSSNKNAPTKITITREDDGDINYTNSITNNITNSNDKKNPVKLKVNCEPSGSNPGTIKWEIINGKDMAKVTSNGEVYITKKNPSMATVSVKATTKNGGISATYTFLYKP